MRERGHLAFFSASPAGSRGNFRNRASHHHHHHHHWWRRANVDGPTSARAEQEIRFFPSFSSSATRLFLLPSVRARRAIIIRRRAHSTRYLYLAQIIVPGRISPRLCQTIGGADSDPQENNYVRMCGGFYGCARGVHRRFVDRSRYIYV